MAEVSREKISRKNKPTFIVKRNDRLSKMKAKHFNQKFQTHFSKNFEQEIVQPEINSAKDLAENLRKYNKKLDDNVFVYF